MTRLAVLSDIHANAPALRAVIADLRGRDVDAVAYLGDIVFRGPDPAGSIALLASLEPVVWIRGNTDEWYLEDAADTEAGGYVAFGRGLLHRPDRVFLGELPRQAVTRIGETSVLCVHGSPRSQSENVFPDAELDEVMVDVTEDVVVCGHTHLPFLGGAGAVVVCNVGSVGMPFDGDPRASYALLSTSGEGVDIEIVRVPYDTAETVALARAAGLPHADLYEQAVREGVPAFG
jgi:putative phosphoesterase